MPLGLLSAFALLVAAQLAAPSRFAFLLHTADPWQSKLYLLTALAHLAAALLVVLWVDSAQKAVRLLMVIVGAGVLQALVAVVLYASGANYQYLYMPFDVGGRATGTFANADHLAGYMELCLAAGVGMMLAQFGGSGSSPAGNWRQRTVLALDFLMSAKMLLRLMLVVMVVALVMTHSRMGNGAFFLALLLVGALVAAVSQRLRRPALWLVASMALIDLIVIGQWVGLDRVVERLDATAQSTVVDAGGLGDLATLPPRREESIQQRLQVPLLSLPLVASGPGSAMVAAPTSCPCRRSSRPAFRISGTMRTTTSSRSPPIPGLSGWGCFC